LQSALTVSELSSLCMTCTNIDRYMDIHLYTDTDLRVYTFIHIYIHIYIHIHNTYTYIYIIRAYTDTAAVSAVCRTVSELSSLCTTYTNIHRYMDTHLHTDTDLCVYAFIHTYTYIHIYTYIHADGTRY
jgi:hypothetical protein